MAILDYRHICRLQVRPEALLRSVAGFNAAPFEAIQGTSDFCFAGSITDWNRLDQLHRISQPALLLCGLHDLQTPACSGLMHRVLPNSQVSVFSNSSHVPFFEEPDAYFTVLLAFLDAHIG